MPELVLHDATKVQLRQFSASPAHAVLLVGPDGIGKTAVAEDLVARLLELELVKLATYPHFLRLQPDGDSISIEAIRQLQKFLQLKTAGTKPLRRAVLIEHAQGLTTEAQNAYLKLLEEPPADTVMVLTVNSPHSLLPTILSRMQTITIRTPGESQLQDLLNGSSKDETARRQAYFMSGGLPGLLTALIQDDATHPLVEAVAQAKEILQKTPFERLAMVDTLSKQKEQARAVVEALERIVQAGLDQATNRQDAKRIAQWHRLRKEVLKASNALSRSANAKLALSNLFLHL